ncbi:MAG TPA: NADH-ubiquinone oxidoreductase-F iron-sulfur binding region domain-containing protein [Gemmataceae bacterium]|jgi:formate dehydrogenase/NADH-quinone oxidoreductase subunit F|nr:NADH-ubiquinone oxidoreductase-F iron-sulfur binding region domain-containing protein [Gemmataceae bacterium]
MQLIPLLSAVQHERGHLSEATLRDLSRAHNVPLYRLQELVSFYPHFRTAPPPRVELNVCRDMSCWLAGGPECSRQLHELTAPDVEIHEVSCVGRCDRSPTATINGVPVPAADLEQVKRWVADPALIPDLSANLPRRWSCDPYPTATDRYATLDRARRGGPSEIAGMIATLKESGLRGMGGAGFPAGTKGELVARETRTPKYVICNADESEPGTFKDREILADLPHLVIEGMALSGLGIGANKGILYLRHEYGPEQERFEAELKRAYDLGILGKPDASGWQFDIEVFVSPGGYILGEETALLEALEDNRGEPRNKPPFPGTHGLHGQPTLINNVETLCHATALLANGVDWWKAQGAPGFAGLKFIAVSGHVTNPGVYLVPMGTTVRALIELAGGMKDGRKLLAFAPGGASSNFLPADRVDVPLDFAALQKAGSMLGSGALVVVAEGTDLFGLATNVTRFFRNESCGKCVPCRVGSQKAVEILEGVQAGTMTKTELDLLPELADTMLQTSICGLGQVAVAPALSLLKNFNIV